MTSPKELLELTLQTTQQFREQHIAQLKAAKQLISEASRSLQEQKTSQTNEIHQFNEQLKGIVQSSTTLNQRLTNAKQQKMNLINR